MRSFYHLPRLLVALLLFSYCLLPSASCQPIPSVGLYDVVWTSPSMAETESMPLGNGDITLSVWIEAATGDLMYYAQQSAAFEENGQVVKLIRGRVHLTLPSSTVLPPVFDQFQHRLLLDTATQFISYTVGGVSVDIDIWVDRHYPVAHFDVRASQEVAVTNSIEQWRTAPTHIDGNWQSGYYCTSQYVWPDVLYSGSGWGSNAGQLLWYHRNDHDLNNTYYSIALAHQNLTDVGLEPYDPLVNRTFGGFISHGAEGDWSAATVAVTSYGLNATLSALAPVRRVNFDLFAFTTFSESEADFIARFHTLVDSVPPASTTRAAHAQWWHSFWNRSHTFIHIPSSPQLSYNLTQRIILQRALDAMDGLNDYPIHFNGQGWFIGSYDDGPQGPDLRQWGSAFW